MGNGETKKYGSIDSVFVLCETCHWCATYFDKSRVPVSRCPICGNTSISTFPILPNEEFTFNFNEKRGVELEFGLKKKEKNKNKGRG
jgi:ribosomal protein S27E